MASKDIKKYAGAAHQGPDRSAPYPISRLAPPMELVDLAREIAHADNIINVRASAKLKIIADQIKALQAQAQAALEEARRDQELHRAQCHFKRIPGKTYHLYRKPDGACYFSMLSPQDWRGAAPHAYEGSFRLENDMSWTPAERLDSPDDSREIVYNLLNDKGGG